MSKESYSLDDVVKDAQGKMRYINLGPSGLRVSRISLGMMSYGSKKWLDWVLEEDEALPLIKAAYDVGIQFFDTADIYSNGYSHKVLAKAIKQYNLPREDIVVATKLFALIPRDFEKGLDQLSREERERRHYSNQQGLSRKHIFDSVERSLKELDLEYIDLLQIHRADENTPFEETMCALKDIIQSGKVRYIGASSMFAWQFMEYQSIAKRNGWPQFISMQNYYCASYREEEREMMPCIKKMGISSLPWSPIAGGYLARPHAQQRGMTSRGDKEIPREDTEIAVNEAIKSVADRLGITMAQVAIAWTLANPVVAAPIVGISNARSLDDAVKALDVVLSDEDKEKIGSAYTVRKIIGHS